MSGASIRSARHGADIGAVVRTAAEHARALGKEHVRAAALEVRNSIELQLGSEPARTGRLYARGGRRTKDDRRLARGAQGPVRPGSKLHRASAPGESPAPDSGALHGSVQMEFDESTATALVTVGRAYGRALEYGTSRIAPRPFVRPAVQKAIATLRTVGIRLRRAS